MNGNLVLPIKKCHYGVAIEDIWKVIKLLTLKSEFFTIYKCKIKSSKINEG
jgi:hypothetical protein